MIISDKEREILGLSDDSELAYKTEDIILDTYFDPNSDRLKVLYDCIKRLIIEYLQKKNIEVDENVSFNLDDLLKEIIKINEDLPSFDLSLYDDPNKLNAYFRSITNNISFEDISHIKVIFDNMNDGFRAYFANYVPKFPVIVSSLLLELQEREPDPIFDNLEFVSSSSDVFDSDDDWDLSDFEFDEDEWETSSTPKEEPLTPENLIDYLKFINVVFTLTRYRQNGIDASDMMFELIREKKLDYYYSDKDFMKLFDRIMEHDKSKHRFYFHGL